MMEGKTPRTSSWDIAEQLPLHLLIKAPLDMHFVDDPIQEGKRWEKCPHLLCFKAAINEREALVDYYHRALHAPSPLFPKENDPYLAFVTPDSTQPWEDVCQNLIV